MKLTPLLSRYSPRYICIFAIFFVLQISTLAQKRYLFHDFTTRDGLINNGVFSINQDKRGYIWFATAAGVSRFDGYKFDNQVVPEINKNGAFSQDIEKDSNGNLNFTSFGQGLLVEKTDGSYKQYLLKKSGVGKNLTRTLKACRNGKLLVSSGSSFYEFKNSKFKLIYDYGRGAIACNTIECDEQNNIWFGGIFGLAVIYAADTTHTPYFLPELKDVFVINILFDSPKRLLIGTQTGYYTVSFKSLISKHLNYIVQQPISELKGTYINHIFRDRQSNIWISTMTMGVFKTHNSKIIENISVANGMATLNVACTFQDREGNFWFATSNGVSKLVSFQNYAFSYDNKPISGVTSIISDRYKRLWVWDEANLYIIAGTKVNKIDITQTSFFNDGIYTLYASKNGTVYIVNGKGLYSLPADSVINIQKAKLKIDFIKGDVGEYRSIYEDEKGIIIIGSDNGIFAYKNNELNKCVVKSDKKLLIRSLGIEKDKYGYYWFGDYSNGLYRMHMAESPENTVIFDNIKIYKALNPDSAFITVYITDLTFDYNGNLWISSLNTGIYKLKIDETGVKDYQLYSIKQGLSGNYINEITEDNNHNIWVTTKRGANCIMQQNGRDTILDFNSKKGLGDEVFKIFPTDSSVVYISFAEGFYAINNSKTSGNINEPPQVLLTAISIMGKIDSAALHTCGYYKLPYNRNFISFDFVSVSFKHENGILYQYKLEGVDKDWSAYSDRRYVSYNSLPPGKYTFKVRALAENGLTSKSETMFSFKITPPFYKTWWFMLLVLATIIFTGYAIYNNRIKQLLKVERLRTRIASDLHDDVGSTLSSISILSEILSAQLDNNPKSAEMIGKIGINARNMLESMDDIIWAVNPSNDKFQNLGLRIREYAIPLFESKNIKFQVQSSETLALLHIPMEIRRNVYLIAKEAINNLVKYSECSESKIEFTENHSNLIMNVIDNGKGFDPNISSPRNGLKNMKRRAAQIKANIDIFSEPDKGTTITLQVKII